MLANQIAVDLIPQGTFVERIRAGGCGLGGVLTPTGVGTSVAEGKRQIEVNGTTFLLETALRAQFALVHAFLADYLGNLTYALTARNFNPVMAMAADTVIVTAEHIVPVGVIAPDHVVTPAPLVDYLDYERVNHGCTDHHRPARRAGAPYRRSRQSRDRHSNAGCQLRSTGAQGFLSVGKRIDRYRTDTGARDGPSASDRRGRQSDQRPARRQHLRQRDVLWVDPRRPCRRDGPWRPAGRLRMDISPTG